MKSPPQDITLPSPRSRLRLQMDSKHEMNYWLIDPDGMRCNLNTDKNLDRMLLNQMPHYEQPHRITNVLAIFSPSHAY
jgi:hypothetical protein